MAENNSSFRDSHCRYTFCVYTFCEIIGTKYQAVDSGAETLEWALQDLVHQVEEAADEDGADKSLKQELVGRIKSLGMSKAEEESASTLWTIAKAGLRILGIPIP
ncbi:MAG: hypothetical protein JSW61_04060 [Candidatus Thorarchaeota archaeon]|nr:MAG: hypothetical protein JSW61_04060 [Candidatus Thorarchaeota archaeon]